MFCSQCGADLVDGVCPNCAAENAQVTSEPEYVEVEPKKKKNLTLAIICLATGIASLVWALTPAAIASLITGYLFKKNYGESNGMVKAGTVCAILAIVVPIVTALVFVALYVCYIVFVAILSVLALTLGGSL